MLADVGVAQPDTPLNLQNIHVPTPGLQLANKASGVSLSANFIPHKFSDAMLSGPIRRRKGDLGPKIPKVGGGIEAFRSGEARMPGESDEDYDGVQSGWFGNKDRTTRRRMRWTRFKWILFFSNILVWFFCFYATFELTNRQLSVYALVALIFCLLTWFNIWTHADIVRVGNHPELVLSTIAASLGIFTSLIGWAGILLNNRAFLAWYTFLLWVTFAFIVAPGYITYKKRTFNLEGKINAQWSRDLGAAGRLRIQDQLDCCGYFSPFIEATVSQSCYSRSILPGCKGPYIKYEQMILDRWYTVVFSIVPFHLIIMVAALLCSNHVTYRFGKGMMPKAYRLSMDTMGIIIENYSQCVLDSYHHPSYWNSVF